MTADQPEIQSAYLRDAHLRIIRVEGEISASGALAERAERSYPRDGSRPPEAGRVLLDLRAASIEGFQRYQTAQERAARVSKAADFSGLRFALLVPRAHRDTYSSGLSVYAAWTDLDAEYFDEVRAALRWLGLSDEDAERVVAHPLLAAAA